MEIAAYTIFAINTLAEAVLLISAIKYLFALKKVVAAKEKCIQHHSICRLLAVGTIFCYGVMIACIFFPNAATGTKEENMGAGILLTFGEALIWTIGMYGFNWKVELYDDYFTHTNFIGVKNKYTYDEIEIRRYNACKRIFTEGRYRFTISYLQENSDAINIAIARYRHRLKQEAKQAEEPPIPQEENE